ncbi:2-hydroxymuconate tautomerase [Suttonella ornithocola]|uniref:Probable tautomerase SA1195.1 n=1 Tax=Suttonella ornithocola TaxID=279832 RepID=A0A380MUI8_9GAMM|nr:2-hydroxymuconate tautomerase [Suttonella ornithocola]SUO95583.1 Probable tautomerase SA1195.1 [Suttonella ornithocola]
MPIVNIKIIEGRNLEQKREMGKAVTKAIADTLGIPEAAVWISIEDLKPENLCQGGELRIDKKS